jgi:hypothetical protein
MDRGFLGYLSRVDDSVRGCVFSGRGILEKVESEDEQRLLEQKIELGRWRSLAYGVKKPPLPEIKFKHRGGDPFDEFSDFFIYYEECDDYDQHRKISKVVRAVKRDNSLRILPSELNLMTKEQIEEFLSDNDCVIVNGKLQDPDLDDEGKRKIRDILRRYEKGTVYEVGGLFGGDEQSGYLDPVTLILGVGQIAYDEKWDLVIQTLHPRHAQFYRNIYPYKTLAESRAVSGNGRDRKGFLDYCGRPAVTLAIDGVEFRQRYGEIKAALGRPAEQRELGRAG